MTARRLYRSCTDRRIAGVCGGIAEYFDIDPAVVRIAAIVLFFIHGIGLLAYLVAWIAIPARPAERAAAGSGPGAPPGAGGADLAGSVPGPAHGAAPVTGPAAYNLEAAAGALFIAAGILFLLLNTGVLDWEWLHFWRWRVIWPVALIALGLYVVVSSVRAHERARRI